MEFEDEYIDEEEHYVLTEFSQTQKDQLIASQDQLESYWNVFPVFGFNSTKYDFILKKS